MITQRLPWLLCISLIGTTLARTCNPRCTCCKTTFSARPQGNYFFTTLMATADVTHHPHLEENYLTETVIVGYRHNLYANKLGSYFLKPKCPLTFGAANTNIDIQNLQLGLAQDYQGTLNLCPAVSDILIDLDLFFGIDAWIKGLWLRLNLPLVRNSWTPCMCAKTTVQGATTYPDGFADEPGIEVPVTIHDGAQATCGDEAFGQITALDSGKLCCTTKKLWGLSDVHLELGYDFIRRPRGNVGVALVGAVGTGKPNGKSANAYLAAPTIGAQNSSQLGAAVRGQWTVYTGTHTSLALIGDMRAMHLFAGCTKRLLNWNVGNQTAFNYWLLINHYEPDGTYVDVAGTNLLNKQVKVSAAAMGEATLMLQIKRKCWQIGLGYDFWGRTAERLCLVDKTIGTANDYYALKDTTTWGTHLMDPSIATIAYQPETASKEATLRNIQKYALTCANIDLCAAQNPTAYSNTLFATIGYTFNATRCTPYVAISGHGEWGSGNTALSTWGIYLSGGLAI